MVEKDSPRVLLIPHLFSVLYMETQTIEKMYGAPNVYSRFIIILLQILPAAAPNLGVYESEREIKSIIRSLMCRPKQETLVAVYRCIETSWRVASAS